MKLISRGAAAARVRAAIAYAGYEYSELAQRTGIGEGVLRRIAAKKPSAQRGATIEQLWVIADACGVPRSFMEFGFDLIADVGEDAELGSEERSDILRRLRAVERELEDLRRREQPDTAQLVEMFASAFREREPAAEDEAARGSVRRTARRSAT